MARKRILWVCDAPLPAIRFAQSAKAKRYGLLTLDERCRASQVSPRSSAYHMPMNKIAMATLAVAASLMPFVARADTSPNPQMQQMRQNMMQMHRQARTATLAALTPAHRSLLNQVVGQLATDPNAEADMPAAARTLDNALTPAESQSILRIHNNLKTQTRQMMESAHAQMPNRAAQDGHWNHGPKQAGNHARQTDPGYILLRMAMLGPGAGHGMH